MHEDHTGNGFYIFGLAQGKPVPTFKGFKGASLEIVAQAGATSAIGCAVPLEDFNREVVAIKKQDAEWLSELASIHYDCCDKLFKYYGSFLPFKIFTILSNREAVQEMIELNRREIETEFRKKAGMAEFGMRLYCPEEWLENVVVARTTALRELKTEMTNGGGKAFFARKRFEQELATGKKRQVPQITQRLAALVGSKMGLTPAEINMLELPAKSFGGYVPLANITLLLKRNRLEELLAVTEQIEGEMIKNSKVEVFGPVPPYSFTSFSKAL